MKKIVIAILALCLALSCCAVAEETQIAACKVGDYLTFGSYPQGANEETAPIEWLVLAVEDGKALVVSHYALDCRPYHTSKEEALWESSSLRQWLNDTFLNEAFTSGEQSAILTVDVDNSPEQGCYGTQGGADTQDQVFLLSYGEAMNYFGGAEAFRCAPTEYTQVKGAMTISSYQTEGMAACYWWLRSPGKAEATVCYIGSSGKCDYSEPDFNRGAIRPACWLDLSADIF